MREYDLVIRGGTIVDGTGIPRYRADLAVRDGRIAKISGRIPQGSAKEIDAGGCIVAPGAIDLHTHYDAQLNWDPYCSLSGWFGVTSLTIGQCGFGFAPTRPEDRELNMLMMNRIEAIPLRSMQLGMRWDWETYPEYLDSLDRQGLGLNIGSLFPFSPMRGYVLGMMEARERTSVTEGELNRERELFDEAMRAGAFGFSLNLNLEDRPAEGGFLPSQVASEEEFYALAEILGKYGVGHIGHTIAFGLTTEQGLTAQKSVERMMRLSGRPFHLGSYVGNEDEWVASCRAQGLPVILQQQCVPIGYQFKLAEFNSYDYMPNWVEPLIGAKEERAVKLRDPNRRALMKKDVEEWASVQYRTDWSWIRVLEVVHERNFQYEGMTIKELAEATGKHPVDAFLDLSLDEDLETEFQAPTDMSEDALKLIEGQIKDPYNHISVSDGGAHTRFLTVSNWPLFWLSYWIRDREIMSLEQGTYKISAYSAWIAGFKNRGTLRVGDWADIIVYNLDELGNLYEKSIYANDFPGDERRVIQKAKGLQYTIVNGTVTFEENNCTGALPGKLLRSYDMVQ